MVGKMYCVDGENIIEIAVHNFEKKNIKVFREKRLTPVCVTPHI